jgi:copper chaperone CopZ
MQTVAISVGTDSYQAIMVQKDIPVRWIIQVDEQNLNECNKAITIPYFGIDKKLSVGQNIVEFIPHETGEFVYTCWMGMIKSKIIVVDELENTGGESESSAPVSTAGSSQAATNQETRTAAGAQTETSESPAQTSRRPASQSGGSTGVTEPAKPLPPQPASITKVILIDGMTCAMCVKHVTDALLAVDGVQDADVVIGKATVTLNRTVSDDVLKSSVEGAGMYTVTSISEGDGG